MMDGFIRTSFVGGISIAIFGVLSWVARKKYKAQGIKTGWIFISIYMLLPLNLISLPHTHICEVRLPNFAIKSDGNVLNAGGNVSQLATQDKLEAIDGSKKFFTEISAEEIVFVIWAMGVLFLIIYQLASYYRMCSRVRRWSYDCKDKAVLKTVEDISLEIGLKTSLQVKIIEDCDSGPFTMGLLKNTVFLPNADLMEKDLYYILKHEFVHCKKKDILWKLLFLAVNIVHWLNPLVWLMRRLAESDLEQACDEEVLKKASSEEYKEYSDVILAWVGSGRPSALSTAYVAGTAFLKQRFTNIYESCHKQNGIKLAVITVLLMFAINSTVNVEMGEKRYLVRNIPITGGLEVRTDIDGDGKPERVYITDNRSGDYAFTQVSAQFQDGDTIFMNYEDYWSSYIVTGDLSGNGKADVVVMKISTGSTYGGGEVTILHLENGKWKEYASSFLHNPSIELEQPENFQSSNFDFSAMGAAIITKNHKTMLRIIANHDMTKDMVKRIDCSYQDEGWYIEDMEIVDNYYSDNKEKELLGDFFN